MERRIELEGCLNFRDLGGYPTESGRSIRWRLLFRSDALHRLSAGDLARLRDELRIAAVIDLRSSGELAAEGRGPLEAEPIDFHHLPFFDREREATPPREMQLGDRYFLLAEHARARVARAVEVLADAPGPAVYHCAAGKDRTGLLSAVLLGLLGVPDELVLADYALTRQNLDAILDRLASMEGYRGILAELPPETLHAEPETMQRLLERVREGYGSMRAYVEAAGVAPGSVERFEQRVLE